ncbi:hypothetical protein [Streptomyces sp. NPDC002685]|uniref:hypothetical protein n=1 Tax=Streptomyces sp. NPDC002685 TaxID=3154540 RepID=UPI0033174942
MRAQVSLAPTDLVTFCELDQAADEVRQFLELLERSLTRFLGHGGLGHLQLRYPVLHCVSHCVCPQKNNMRANTVLTWEIKSQKPQVNSLLHVLRGPTDLSVELSGDFP